MTAHKQIPIALMFMISSSIAIAQQKCRTESVNTPHGRLEHVICRDAEKRYVHTIQIEGQPLLQEPFLAEELNNKKRSLWILSGKPVSATGCAPSIYLIDLSMQPVKVIAFGVKKACNEFHWASWGERRSVIALKNNVKFTYENGKMTLPASGEKLWKAIEPPHAGAGLAEEDAIAFAEEVPLPK